MATRATVWLIDDDDPLRELLRHMVAGAGHRARGFASGVEALAQPGPLPDAVILDLVMPEMDGADVLRELMRRAPGLPVIVLTAVNEVSRAVEVTKLGAYDYLVKPVEEERLLTALGHALSHRTLEREVARLRGELAQPYHLRNLVGSSPAMRRIYEQIERILDSEISVFISGESGTGKELVARAIHYGSPRSARPFIGVNCAAIPEGLQESELFGHEKGAFTGAVTAHPGKFEQAEGGTILLDEVGEMAPSSQARLLRVLQERRLVRVGGTRVVELDVRVISASNRDLEQLATTASFRQDLYYRLVVYPIHIPPLRERQEDIHSLVQHFLVKYAQDTGHSVTRVQRRALDRLLAYPWPGNVRELENVVHRSLLHTSGPELRVEDLPTELGGRPMVAVGKPEGEEVLTLAEAERQVVERALEACGGNLTEAARRLGIGRTTLYRKLEKYGLKK